MIDWARLKQLQDEIGTESFGEIVNVFMAEMDDEVAKLSGTEDGTKLAAQLHFLKGGALNMGFQDFATLCSQYEKLLNDDPSQQVDINTLLDLYQTSQEAFQKGLPDIITPR